MEVTGGGVGELGGRLDHGAHAAGVAVGDGDVDDVVLEVVSSVVALVVRPPAVAGPLLSLLSPRLVASPMVPVPGLAGPP